MAEAPFPPYRRAICRKVPSSFAAGAVRMEEPESAIDMARLEQQHQRYVEVLRDLLPDGVIELEADEAHPDCVFVEDNAVVIGRRALICRMGHASRRGEEEPTALALAELGYVIIRVEAPATIDGGDVLFTGTELFAGLSKRTNEAGIAALRAAFAPIPTHAIRVREGLHLKSVMTMCAPGTIAVADTAAAAAALQDVQAAAATPYRAVTVADWPAANCLLINGVTVARPEFPASLEQLRAGGCGSLRTVEAGEVQKADGLLTCCSLLLEH